MRRVYTGSTASHLRFCFVCNDSIEPHPPNFVLEHPYTTRRIFSNDEEVVVVVVALEIVVELVGDDDTAQIASAHMIHGSHVTYNVDVLLYNFAVVTDVLVDLHDAVDDDDERWCSVGRTTKLDCRQVHQF